MARRCFAPAALSTLYTRMLVSSVKRSLPSLMERRAIEAARPQWPALFHSGARPCPRRFLVRPQHAPPADRHESRDGLPVARDHVFLAGLDVTDTARERLVGIAKGDDLAHGHHYVAQ